MSRDLGSRVRVGSRLTIEQGEKDAAYHHAIEVLRAAGYETARYVVTICTKRTDEPGYIVLE